MEIYDKIINLLPYHLQNGENNKKIIKGFADLLVDVKEMQDQVAQIGDVNSTGILLDYTGVIVNEYRNGESDEDFRLRIITKILKTISLGDIETINGLGVSLFGDAYKGVFENWNYIPNQKECTLTLIYDINEITENPRDIIKSALAGGVGLETAIEVYQYAFDSYEFGVTNLTQFPVLINP